MSQSVPENLGRGKEFAPEYREEFEEIDPDNITEVTLAHRTVDITYFTRKRTKTVRCVGAIGQTSYNDVPDGFYSFFDSGTGKKYAYNPDEKRLISMNDELNRTIAEGDDFHKFEEVTFPNSAVVKGAIGTDVEATVYYRSPRSEEMQSVTLAVSFMDGEAARISGEEVGTGRRLEAETRRERDIVSKHGTEEMYLGKVARVEFPRGHQFTVEIEGLSDTKAEKKGEERIVKKVKKAFRNASVDISVTHNGRLEWD